MTSSDGIDDSCIYDNVQQAMIGVGVSALTVKNRVVACKSHALQKKQPSR